MDRLKGYKTYAIAALMGLVAFLSGADLDGIAATVSQHQAETGAVLAAGIILGRAIVALFGAIRRNSEALKRTAGAVLAVLLLFGATGTLSACSGFQAGFQQVTPRNEREALAVAEVTFVGVVSVAADLHRNGILSTEDARNDVLPALETVNDQLAVARRMIVAGDQARAGQVLAAVMTILRQLSVELAARRDAAANAPPEPVAHTYDI